MTTGDGLPPLREVIRACGLVAKRSLGQNFLLDFNLTRRIARAAGPLEGVTIVEVGPGPGGLTRALFLEGAERVVAIERDERCLKALDDIAALYPGRLDIVSADARNFDYGALGLPPRTRIVANLPYSVGTPLFIGWLKTDPWPPWFDRLVLMFQREVADRIVAAPGGKDYGRLSVLSQWRTQPKILFNVPADAFTPKPKVEFRRGRARAAARSGAGLRREAAGAGYGGRLRPTAQDAARELAPDHAGRRNAARRARPRPESAGGGIGSRRFLPHRQRPR